MQFTRKIYSITDKYSYDSFSLTPEENSDYIFSMSNVGNSQAQPVKVYKVGSNGKEKLVDTISKTTIDKNGNTCYNYALEGGKKYIIKAYCNSLTSGMYIFTAEQDNWVYAPNI